MQSRTAPDTNVANRLGWNQHYTQSAARLPVGFRGDRAYVPIALDLDLELARVAAGIVQTATIDTMLGTTQ